MQIEGAQHHQKRQGTGVMDGAVEHGLPELSGCFRTRIRQAPYQPNERAEVPQCVLPWCLELPLSAPQHPADSSDAAEIGGRIINRLQHRSVICEHLAARAFCFEVETDCALIARILRAGCVRARKEAPLAQQPTPQLCRWQRVQQPNYGHRDRRILDALDDPLGGVALLAVETDDEAGEHENARVVDFIDALLQTASGVLLLLGQDQSVRIRTLNPNEDCKEIRCCQGAQQFQVIGQIDRSFGRKFEGKVLFVHPTLQIRQKFSESLFVANQIVVDKINMAAIAERVQGVEFGQNLLVGLGTRHSAVQLNDVAELTIERATARELDADVDIILEL